MFSAVDRNDPDEIHPSLWRASQLARGNGRSVETGYASLSAELPGGGWPVGALIELLPQHSGIGELRLLQPALASLGKRPVGLIEPPHPLYGPGLGSIGLPLDAIVQIKAPRMADKLWAAEQILRTGSFGALLLWLQQVPQASLRRLHLAAQSSETLFIVVRPEWAATQASPATLRLGLRPAEDGLAIDILKRRGPVAATPLAISVQQPVLHSRRRRARVPAPITVSVEAAVEA
ncbi:translesion DNA synthesis-associated protein ImuA [Paraburkholderia rhizosphaerae]|uniref:Cell division inhibitor SulA/protein ImuA n=1 Tax=Paraburkholderia rhizosphaerae TaxID=480658 RepID=A0A4V3HEL0_9BURK|nr:translesion DNA synthesis-associated protein ImuA [Paraburkholderia rhizosphaerae]TDY48109.1 cell division inhibitor SulA/protein ImuA [Paraburkholderia rhizosphaerae]